MLELVQSHLKANEDHLNSLVLENSFNHLDLHVLSQLKGQIYALKEVLNIREYLIEKIQEEEDEVRSIRPESAGQSKED